MCLTGSVRSSPTPRHLPPLDPYPAQPSYHIPPSTSAHSADISNYLADSSDFSAERCVLVDGTFQDQVETPGAEDIRADWSDHQVEISDKVSDAAGDIDFKSDQLTVIPDQICEKECAIQHKSDGTTARTGRIDLIADQESDRCINIICQLESRTNEKCDQSAELSDIPVTRSDQLDDRFEPALNRFNQISNSADQESPQPNLSANGEGLADTTDNPGDVLGNVKSLDDPGEVEETCLVCNSPGHRCKQKVSRS